MKDLQSSGKEPVKIKHQIKKEVKQEYKLLGTAILKPGVRLYAMGNDLEVYEIEIVQRKTINFQTQKKKSAKKATINPNHIMLKAINMKNAKRKFRNMLIPSAKIQFDIINR